MTLLQKLDELTDVTITDVFTETAFEFTTHDHGTWYFVGQDRLGRWELASRCNSKELFNSEQQIYNHIRNIAK